MKINHIAIMNPDGVIAENGDQPFKIKEDLRRFEALTTGRSVIVGRKTFEVFPFVLPDRKLIVLTRDRVLKVTHEAKNGQQLRAFIQQGQTIKWRTNGRRYEVAVAGDINEALGLAEGFDVYVAGGAEVYRETLDIADQLRLTIVDSDDHTGDVKRYPEFSEDWKPVYVEERGTHTFIDFARPRRDNHGLP